MARDENHQVDPELGLFKLQPEGLTLNSPGSPRERRTLGSEAINRTTLQGLDIAGLRESPTLAGLQNLV